MPRVWGRCQESWKPSVRAEGWEHSSRRSRSVSVCPVSSSFSSVKAKQARPDYAPHTVSCVTGQEPRAWRTHVFYGQWRACLTFTRGRSSVFIALDSTHTCPLLQREAPSLIPKAVGCTDNPWKGSPEQKQSMLLFARPTETRHLQRTASWHTFLQKSAVFKAWPSGHITVK